jgi:hypothetical protein
MKPTVGQIATLSIDAAYGGVALPFKPVDYFKSGVF